MIHKTPIRLKVSTRKDFVLPLRMLNGLVVIAALISPHPFLLAVFAIMLFAAGWAAPILGFPKTNSAELISIIFPDGRLRLESDRETIFEGFLNGQQWCSRRLAVLRITNGDKTRKLVIRTTQQQGPDDFRRLTVWLRQDLCSNTRVGQVLDS